jgi:hypothetical protein
MKKALNWAFFYFRFECLVKYLAEIRGFGYDSPKNNRRYVKFSGAIWKLVFGTKSGSGAR